MNKVGKKVVFQVDIRHKLKENMGGRVEITTRDKDRVVGVVEWLSPDQQMAEIRLSNGEIKTLCDTEIVNIKKL